MTGTNFGPTETVKVYADGIGATPAYTGTTDAAGTMVLSGTVRATTNGPHTLIAIGQSSGDQATAPLTILARLTLKPASGLPGSRVTGTGTGFGAKETVKLHWKSPSGTVLGTTTSTGTGTATVRFTVPSSAPGTYTVYAVGSTTKARAPASFIVT